MLRQTTAISIAVLMLAACAPAAPDPASMDADGGAIVGAAAAGTTAFVEVPEDFALAFEDRSENYEISLDIDPAIETFDKALAVKFWGEAKAELEAFAAMADLDRKTADDDAATTGGESWFRTYTLDLTYRAGAVLDDAVSITESASHYTGGAHPNFGLSGGVYRRGETTPLALSGVITDPSAFKELVIKALVEEKLLRGYQATERASVETELRELLVPSAENTNIFDGRFVLEPSSEAGKAGGISVLYSPYDVGAYAEGAYIATVPAAALAPILTESWAARFGGAPVMERETP